MGAEEAVRALLDTEGWSLRDGAILAASQRARGDPAAARATVLDADLRAVGKPSLPRWAYGGAREAGAGVTGPMVLQVMDARDISSPKRASGSSGRRMLRLDLTDGDATVVAVEYRELTSVEDASALAPGTKVAVPPGVRIRCQSGILLAHGDALRVLGGKVAALAEEWEGVRAVAETGDAEQTGTDAPRFETYDREKAEATVAAAVAGRAAANKAAAEAIAEKRTASTSTSTSTASPAPETERGEEPAPFVPRRRPALPPTRAQRAAAQAAGVKLPPPGAPMPSTPEETATGRTVEPEGAPATSPGRSHIAQEVKESIPKEVKEAIPSPPPGFRARAAPEEEATAPVDPPPAPAPAFAPTVTEEDRRSRLLSRFASDSREGRGSRDRGREDRGRGDRDHGRGDRDRGRGGRGGRREGERRGGGGRRGGDEERDDGFRTLDRTASGSRTEDDEALARQLQRDLELEDSGYVATDAAALAASLFSFPAREQEREDSGRRGRR
ncbi:predicted protein [Micromonas commoda]|uniref:RecQ-mediated genome instability protein 1 n=1 Tax=Micromonas commoda (strain RCC299 / NOUM17 / CCMP2709) TaxID=296587 RepID=C1E255_MICCC|nr:predicted protein [Micromonas commoda]ACO61859.1 predicted protein [Micromonas commoda]|eukprot:XP_002500601.1 predicted protein [Micromonas commoda]